MSADDNQKSGCNLCGSEERQFLCTLQGLDGKSYNAVRCRKCGLLYIHPLPNLDGAFDQVYSSDYWEAGFGQAHTCQQTIPRLFEACQRQAQIVEKLIGGRGKALDIGCGMGEFLAVLRDRGWEVQGTEVAGYAVHHVRDTLGLPVFHGRLEEAGFPGNHFDLIKLGHVIEHLTDPRSVLQTAYPLLKPGGLLMVDTNNADGLRIRGLFAYKKLFRRPIRGVYNHLIPPEHLYSFSEKTLRRLVEMVGFRVIGVVKPALGDPTYFPDVGLGPVGVKDRVLRTIDALGARLSMGDVLVMYATKDGRL